MRAYLDFERPIAELEDKIQELRQLAGAGGQVDIDDEVARLQAKADQLLIDIYAKLTPWQKTQIARHPVRPHFSDYVDTLIDEFTPLAGDRSFADDKALIGGLGLISVVALGWQSNDFGPLDYARSMRWVIPGVTLAALGFQTILSGFFVSILGMSRR